MKRVTRIESYTQQFEFRLPVGGEIDEDCSNYVPVGGMNEEELTRTAKAYGCKPGLLIEIKDNLDNLAATVSEDLKELLKQIEAK